MRITGEVTRISSPQSVVVGGVHRSGKLPRPVSVGAAVTTGDLATLLGVVVSVRVERLPGFYWLYEFEVSPVEPGALHLGQEVVVVTAAQEDQGGPSAEQGSPAP